MSRASVMNQFLILDDDFAKAEPKRLRYCLLHRGATRAQRAPQPAPHPDKWPWATQILDAFHRVNALTMRC